MRRWFALGTLAIAGLILTTGAALAALSFTASDLRTPAPALGLANPARIGRDEPSDRSGDGHPRPQIGSPTPGATHDEGRGAMPHADAGGYDGDRGDGDHDADDD
jgi:hypothetical protein